MSSGGFEVICQNCRGAVPFGHLPSLRPVDVCGWSAGRARSVACTSSWRGRLSYAGDLGLDQTQARLLGLASDAEAVVTRARLAQKRACDECDAGDGERGGQDERDELHRYAGVYPGA